MNRSFLIAALLAVGLTACGEKPAPAPADAMKADAPKADDAKSTPTAPSGDTKKDPKQPG